MWNKAGNFLFAALLSLIVIAAGAGIAWACQFDLCSSTYYGKLSENSITITREIHQYTFSAQDGDRIIVRVNRTSGTLEPRLAIYDPNGGLIAESGVGTSWAQLLDIYIPATGTYDFRVMDGSGPGRGDYAVSLQSTNRPGNVTTIAFDDVIRDTLEMYSQMNTYRFLADAGESVMLQAIAIEGGVDPRIELFDPLGIRLGSAQDASEAVLIKNSLSTSGYHTIIVSDDRASETGSYFLVVHRLPTDVDDDGDARPTDFALAQNYPNPFNPSTSIEYTLARSLFVEIDVYNVIGERVTNLVSRTMSAGSHTVIWDGRDANGEEAASGIYYYTITTPDFTDSKKMLLLK
ncbi:MAG: FlgD immunoglobulin-like domain containing protein [Candidatus Zixiibacteriota bacterium]